MKLTAPMGVLVPPLSLPVAVRVGDCPTTRPGVQMAVVVTAADGVDASVGSRGGGSVTHTNRDSWATTNGFCERRATTYRRSDSDQGGAEAQGFSCVRPDVDNTNPVDDIIAR